MKATIDLPDDPEPRLVSFHDVAKQYCGIVDSGVSDLASNPKYLEDLSRDSMGDR